jgi:hypothetical protein
MKEYSMAIHAFLTVLCTPTKLISKLMEESYKKCKLLSLLVYGKRFELPRSASSILLSKLTTSENYEEISRIFLEENYQDLLIYILTNETVFQQDQNLHLVQQLLPKWREVKLLLLNETFVTLSINETAEALGLLDNNNNSNNNNDNNNHKEEVMKILSQAMTTKKLRVTVDLNEEMIYFNDQLDNNNNKNIVERGLTDNELQSYMSKVQSSLVQLFSVSRHIQSMHLDVLISPAYILHMNHAARGGGLGSGGRGGPIGRGIGGGIGGGRHVMHSTSDDMDIFMDMS